MITPPHYLSLVCLRVQGVWDVLRAWALGASGVCGFPVVCFQDLDFYCAEAPLGVSFASAANFKLARVMVPVAGS